MQSLGRLFTNQVVQALLLATAAIYICMEMQRATLVIDPLVVQSALPPQTRYGARVPAHVLGRLLGLRVTLPRPRLMQFEERSGQMMIQIEQQIIGALKEHEVRRYGRRAAP
jgi:hypothetical protein